MNAEYTVRWQMRISPAERAAWERAARSEHLKMAQWIRRTLAAEIARMEDN